MTRPFACAIAMAFLALGSPSVYADDSAVPAAAETSAATPVFSLPAFVPASGDFYPPSAASKLQQGSVGIEFQIDDQGRAQILAQTFADDPEFAPNAADFLTKGHFRISPEWVQSGGPGLRFTVEVQFSVARGGDSCEKKPPHVADTEVLVVCRSLPSRRGRRL
jgi:hypothetical protein